MYGDFAAIAAANPPAWQRTALAATDIRAASAHNPMQAFPYTRAHCWSWNVDQAAALLFFSEARAMELGIPRDNWVYPLPSTVSNHMATVSARADLSHCIGADTAGEAALDAAGLTIDQVDLLELYSCFPIAASSYVEALRVTMPRALTITGGMPFAGGPFNNYVLQARCRAAELLRAQRQGTALVSSVSGMLTKPGFGLWSAKPGPRGFVEADVSAAVAAQSTTVPVLDTHTGSAAIAGYTVLYGRAQRPRAVALVDTPTGARVLTSSEDPARIGAPHATTVLSSIGVLQQSLVGEACARIARGEAHTTLVTGADAGYRLLRAQLTHVELQERDQQHEPDSFIAPKDELRHAVELRVGLKMPVGLYAIMESAYRARQGWSVHEHRDRLAALYARFSAIAAANSHAWHRQPYGAAQIRAASAHNPMQAFPYTRLHVSTWNVDQAAALLFCSAARAEAVGIPRARWIYALASSESNHMVPVSAGRRARHADRGRRRRSGRTL